MRSLGGRPFAPRRGVRSLALAATLTAALALAGCTDDSDPLAASSTATTPSASPTASASPTPTITPASGLVLQIRGVSLHAPAGWKPASNKLGDLAQSAYDSRESASVGLYSVPWLNPNEGLRLLTKAVVQMNTYTGKPTVHEPVNINGVDCYHVTGRYPGRQVEDQFGAIYERDQVSFSFTFDDDVSRPARQKIIDSVLATVFWR